MHSATLLNFSLAFLSYAGLASAYAISLTARSLSNESDTASVIVRRDNPFQMDGFRGTKPIGDVVEKDFAEVGDKLSLVLDCGTVEGIVRMLNTMTCNMKTPATMPAGTFTGTTPHGDFDFVVPGSCPGISFGLINHCTGCGDIGEVTTKLDCHGKSAGGKNNVVLCVSGAKLVEC
ncbi:hypothetical protein LSUE1_G009924 [Lachnellula suecica]|uniref:Cyanovirin-N domain-containing protein n=1 Tax=Lachnellula suecica TaxID=602035 RepID=A0A8T9BQL8_9HELO|nr:hypothetical protein LSUE1_G009924 [Lachnellula suecica]